MCARARLLYGRNIGRTRCNSGCVHWGFKIFVKLGDLPVLVESGLENGSISRVKMSRRSERDSCARGSHLYLSFIIKIGVSITVNVEISPEERAQHRFYCRLTLISFVFLSLTLFLSPALATENWENCASTPKAGGYGEAVIGTGDAIYIVRCLYASSEATFWRYDPDTDGWTSLGTPSVNGETAGLFRTGTAFTWDGGDYIYALAGARYSDSDRRLFLRYSIPNDEWSALQDTSSPQGAGDAVCWSGYDNKLYALMGSSSHGAVFTTYDPTTGDWSIIEASKQVDDGVSLVWTGGKYLYALYGEYLETTPTQAFLRYDLDSGNWDELEPIPDSGGVGDGGSLLYLGDFLHHQTDYIYALGGGSCLEDPGYGFYRYTVSGDEWVELEEIPYPVGYYVGNRLGYADESIYYWQGSPTTWDGGGDRFCAYPVLWSAEVTLELSAGWNMVSLSVEPGDPSATSVLGGVGFYQLVTWGGTGYISATEFEAGRGYWLLVLEDVNVTVTGIPVDSLSLSLSPGWSMVGGTYDEVPSADVFPGFYQLVTWTGTGYTPATAFEPGKGYWALVLEENQIQLPPT